MPGALQLCQICEIWHWGMPYRNPERNCSPRMLFTRRASTWNYFAVLLPLVLLRSFCFLFCFTLDLTCQSCVFYIFLEIFFLLKCMKDISNKRCQWLLLNLLIRSPIYSNIYSKYFILFVEISVLSLFLYMCLKIQHLFILSSRLLK